MTVNKTVSTTKSKKKTTTSGASAAASTSTSVQKSSKSSKIVETRSSTGEIAGALSKSSSSSSLQIADVSHLPVQTSVVTYTVTEKLPQDTGEKITTYNESGATSTEYRHFIAQDKSSQGASNITQISSTLNKSVQNLSKDLADDSSISYTVIEPKEERHTYNKNDSAWNGKFVHEKPTPSKRTTVKGKTGKVVAADSTTVTEEFVSASSHQESSSMAKSSSSSRVIEIIDGKERVIDEKHHESGYSTAASHDEHLSSKSGTNITPELHYSQKAKESSTAFDTSKPELTKPKTKSSESSREIHKVGEIQSVDSYSVNNDVSESSLKYEASKVRSNLNDTYVIQKDTIDSASRLDKSRIHNLDETYTVDKSDRSNASKTNGSGSTTVTTTTTYYDSKGNVIKTVPSTSVKQTTSDFITKEKGSKTGSKQKTQSQDERGTSTVTTSTTYYDSKGNVIKSVDDTQRIPSSNSDFISKERESEASQSVRYVDEDYVDTSRIRRQQNQTDSRSFYGHGVDSASTTVKNVYDSTAVQNTIGTKGKILKSDTADSTDVIFSNERTYGKTGWNGKFVYETPTKPKRAQSPTKKTSTPKDKSPTTKKLPKDQSPKDQVITVTTVTEKIIPSTFGETIVKDDSSQISNIKTTVLKDSKTARDEQNFSDVTTSVLKDSKTFVDEKISTDAFTDIKTSVSKDSKTFVDKKFASDIITDIKTSISKDSKTIVDDKVSTDTIITLDTVHGPKGTIPKDVSTLSTSYSENITKTVGGKTTDVFDSTFTTSNVEISVDTKSSTDVRSSTVKDTSSTTFSDKKTSLEKISSDALREDRKVKSDTSVSVDKTDITVTENIVDIKDIVS